MKAVQLDLPHKLAAEIEAYVNAGWFGSEGEVYWRRTLWVSSRRPERARFHLHGGAGADGTNLALKMSGVRHLDMPARPYAKRTF